MKTKMKRHSRSVLSVVLALCMLLSCMTAGMIMTDAAKVDGESVGDTTYYLYKGTSDNSLTQVGALPQNTVSLAAGLNYINVTRNASSWYTDYEWWENKNNSQGTPKVDVSGAKKITFDGINDRNVGSYHPYYLRMYVSKAGDYNFSYDGSNHKLTITGGDDTPDFWAVVGDNTSLFGTPAWNTSTNVMTPNGSSWTWTKENVYLEAGTIQYKVVKNDDWSTAVPKGANLQQPVTASKNYNVTVTYDGNNTVTMELTDAATYSLTVTETADAVVKATYNGTSANEGDTLTGIPGGAKVTISVTPNVGKTCQSITATPPTATITGSGKTWTLTMPSADVTQLDYSWTSVQPKPIYFNNSNTNYAMVSVKYTYGGESFTGTMTRLPNSNIWTIDVPEDLGAITFVGDNGNNTGSLDIPWENAKPKYTAGSNPADPSNGGTWGNYIARSNEVDVTAGSTVTNGVANGTLFAGITATMYDYYVDGEVNSGANNWLNGINDTINSREYTSTGNDWKWNPFTKLNDALSDYADKKGVAYPLYFGNLNVTSKENNSNTLSIDAVGHSQSSVITGYKNWDQLPNSSITLSDQDKKNAVTGLSGTTLAGSNIHYYKNGATNQNGAVMAMFDEDFLSGENNQNAVLATILRASNFPVRKETRGGTTTYPNKIYVDAGSFSVQGADSEGGDGKLWAHFDNGSGTETGNTVMTYDSTSGYYSCDIPSGTQQVTFVRTKAAADSIVWRGDNFWNKSGDYSVETSTASASRLYTFSSWNSSGVGQFTKGDIASSYGTTSEGYTYYTFNSDQGRDNAYIENITKPTAGSKGSAEIEYYENSNITYAATWGNATNKPGFFPFDKNYWQNHVNGTAHDLGFGMKLEIPFTLNENGLLDDGVTPQTFDFSGDDDLWVFVDGNLVLDLGGDHNKTNGTINFATCEITKTTTQKMGGDSSTVTRNAKFGKNDDGWFDNTKPNQVHTMTIYYMERGMFDSNLMFGFSFHAVPEQLQIDKKVRTYDINSGFFTVNNTTRAYDANNNPVLNDHDKEITQFEYTYQEGYTGTKKEKFTINQTGSPKAEDYTLNYSVGTQAYSVTSSQGGTVSYDLYNDKIAYFNGQYRPGTSITFKETIPKDSLYHYSQEFTAVNLAQGSANLNPSGNAENGYAFTMPTGSAGPLSDIRVRARFTNNMLAHDISLTKEVSDETDTATPFTFEIKFKFGNYDYVAYPIDVTVNGDARTLSDAGRISITPGQTLVLTKIPENALVQIVEVLDDSTSQYTYKNFTLTNALNQATIDKGVQFRVGTQDIIAKARNTKGDPVYISHNLYPGSTDDAYTYVSAEVQNKSTGTVVESYPKTLGVITVNKNLITKNSSNKIVITLETVEKGNARFESFWERISGELAELAASGTKYTAEIYPENRRAVITVNITDLFTSGVQTISSLPFYSKLQSYRYTVIFTYTSRLWQDQTYTTKGFFTAEELDKYVDHIDETDGIVMKTAETNSPRDEFIQKKAPYEDNFKQTVSWILKDKTNENPKGVEITQNITGHEIVLNITGMNTSNTTIKFKMNLPFAYTATDKGMVYRSVNEDGSVNYDANQPPFEGNTGFEQLYSLNNDRTPSNACFVQAPESVNNNGVVKHFSYWEVYDYEHTTPIRRCYSRKFNLAFYEPYYIVPIYNELDHISSQASQAQEWGSKKEATIHFLENSRNQWNLGGGNKVRDVDSYWEAYGDRLFSDFVVEYRYNNKLISSYAPEDNVKTGIVIERVQKLTDTEDGKDTDLSNYADVTGADDQGVADVEYYVNNNFQRIDGKALLNSAIDYSDLDNKNMREVYYGFANIYQADQGTNAGNPTTLKNYLYRAYAYIKVGNDDAVVSKPAYFTIYDMASIECYYDNPDAKGGMS